MEANICSKSDITLSLSLSLSLNFTGLRFSSESLGSRALYIGENSKKLESTTFRKLILLPSSGETSKQRADLSHWTEQMFLHLKTEKDPVSETLSFLDFF
jgi:hypothetical protein